MLNWLAIDPEKIGMIAVNVCLAVSVLIILVRTFGLRSFSKLSGFDFAITVSFGSILATIIVSESLSFVQGAISLLFLFLVQFAIAFARRRWRWASRFINNEPRLVWRDGEFIEEQMKKAQISRGDVIAKMREANAIRLDDVLAVVVETTGDISILHQTGDNRHIDSILMDNVLGWSEHVN